MAGLPDLQGNKTSSRKLSLPLLSGPPEVTTAGKSGSHGFVLGTGHVTPTMEIGIYPEVALITYIPSSLLFACEVQGGMACDYRNMPDAMG